MGRVRRRAGLVVGAGVLTAFALWACDDDSSSGAGPELTLEAGAVILPDARSPDGNGTGSSTADAGTDGDAAAPLDGGDAEPPIPNEGNAWGFMSCVYSDGDGGVIGSPCITYTIGHCADESAYGAKCAAGSPPILGPAVCSQDKRSTTYRCHHDWCARGCVPGGAPPNWNWVPVFSCTTSAQCGM